MITFTRFYLLIRGLINCDECPFYFVHFTFYYLHNHCIAHSVFALSLTTFLNYFYNSFNLLLFSVGHSLYYHLSAITTNRATNQPECEECHMNRWSIRVALDLHRHNYPAQPIFHQTLNLFLHHNQIGNLMSLNWKI